MRRWRSSSSNLGDPASAAELVVRFELLVLDELGFGLDLTRCAATGRRDELVYVSPKTGRAVSREAGARYHDKMLALPAFLRRGETTGADRAAIEDAFRLTGFFLTRHVYEPRGDRPARGARQLHRCLAQGICRSAHNGENRRMSEVELLPGHVSPLGPRHDPA